MLPHSPTKAQSRHAVAQRLLCVREQEWRERENEIFARLCSLAVKRESIARARGRAGVAWMGFLPMARTPRDEIDVSVFLEHLLASETHRVCLPRTNWNSKTLDPVPVQNLSTDIVLARYSLREPKADLLPLALGDLDVVIVPGLAFDSTGARLGRGGGFYDRLLARVAGLPAGNRPVSVGVCLDEQVVENVPVEAHDLRVDMMVTPSKAWEPPRATGSHAVEDGEAKKS
jgi:5,10-methenyltetrahydrofolate synthetase